MIDTIAKKSLAPLIDNGSSEKKRFGRLGEMDGKAELPLSDSPALSVHEQQLFDSSAEKWRDFKANLVTERQRLERELTSISSKISHDLDPSELAGAAEQTQAMDLLQLGMGEGSTEYSDLKGEYDIAQSNLDSLKSQLGRPLTISFEHTYLPLMLLLSLAELWVNRLSFELVFESMPLVSIMLAAAVGVLLMFFAHIIGTQFKRSQCPLTSSDNGKTYWAIFFIGLIALLLIFSLAVMRQQLLDLNAASVDLDDLLKDGSSSSAGSINIIPTGKSVPFLVINFAIFISGVVLAFLRHDSHPFYEQFSKEFVKSKKKFSGHIKKYEAKQVEIAKQFNSKLNSNNQNRLSYERSIKEIEDQLSIIARADQEYRDRLVNAVVSCVKEYRQRNAASRKSTPPEYFFQHSIEQHFRARLMS